MSGQFTLAWIAIILTGAGVFLPFGHFKDVPK